MEKEPPSTLIWKKDSMETKYCRWCLQEKERGEFSPDKRQKDGKYRYCKECYNKCRRRYSKKKGAELHRNSVEYKWPEHLKIIREIYPSLGAIGCMNKFEEMGLEPFTKSHVGTVAGRYGIKKQKEHQQYIGKEFFIGIVPAKIINIISLGDDSHLLAIIKLYPSNFRELTYQTRYKKWNRIRRGNIADLNDNMFLCTKCNKVYTYDDSGKISCGTPKSEWKNTESCGQEGLGAICKPCYNKHRRKFIEKNPQAKIRNKAHSTLNAVLAGRNKAKVGSKAHRLFGCTRDELRKHIEEQFQDEWNWDNKGDRWEIDHIVPYSAFDLEDGQQLSECCNYKNIRPLLVKENRSKGAYLLPREEF